MNNAVNYIIVFKHELYSENPKLLVIIERYCNCSIVRVSAMLAQLDELCDQLLCVLCLRFSYLFTFEPVFLLYHSLFQYISFLIKALEWFY
jgi:hypothetical protein